MKKVLRVTVFLFAVLSLVSISYGAEYYMSPNGDDGGDGSIAAPWRTLHSSVNRLSPGDTLYLRGGRYFDQDQVVAEINVAGTAGKPITIRNYSGEIPVLSGTKVIDSGWQCDSGGVYKRVLTDDKFSQSDSFYPRIVIQNLKDQTGGNFLSDPPDPVSSRSEVNASGLWYCDHSTHTLYVYPKDLGAGFNANDYTFEIGDLPRCIIDVMPDATQYLIIEGLTFFGFTGETQDTGVIWEKGAISFPKGQGIRDYLIFKNLIFKNCWVGIKAGDIRHTTVTGCTFENCIDNGIIAGQVNAEAQDDFLVENCNFISFHAPWPAYTGPQQSDAAVKTHGMNGITIRGCEVEGVQANRACDEYSTGLWTDVDVLNALIEENLICDVKGGNGIFVERRCDNNTVQRNIVVRAGQGIRIGSKSQPADDWPENCKVYHNTVVDCEQAGLVLNAGVRPVIKNNIFVNNGYSQIMITDETLNDPRNAEGGIVIDHNDCWEQSPKNSGLYYRVGGWSSSDANANAEDVKSQNAVSGLDNELHVDPLFVDYQGMDFCLSLSSECIDGGCDLGEPYNGKMPDMGRYETSAALPAPTDLKIE